MWGWGWTPRFRMKVGQATATAPTYKQARNKAVFKAVLFAAFFLSVCIFIGMYTVHTFNKHIPDEHPGYGFSAPPPASCTYSYQGTVQAVDSGIDVYLQSGASARIWTYVCYNGTLVGAEGQKAYPTQ